MQPQLLLKIAGIFQIILCAASLFIPKMLGWKYELKKTGKLIEQMFWVYAAYILAINLGIGIVSFFGADELLGKTFLAKGLSIFIFLYWFARVLIQFLYFDTSKAPNGLIYKLGEWGLVTLFIFLTIVYGWVCYLNFT